MKNPQEKPTAIGGGHKFRNDVIFIAVLLAVVTVAGLAFFFLREEGASVRVEVDGEVIGTYSLSIDREIEILTGEDKTQRNLLVIRDGKASVTEASCPDGICAAHRSISRVGESIVCLPHRVVITVTGEDAKQPDVIV